jgi:ubiquinone/menaquinone biosynthesis C-methylase UbiE
MNRSEVMTRRAGTAATASRAQLAYPLPAGSAETERLIRQSAFINSFTRALFAEAGIAPGMRVLDVGSGAGDVALIAADMVGSTGEVVGIDRNGAALAIARARATTVGFAHLTFREGDLAEIGPEEKFDAVVGRLVLMYMPDPAATLRALARHLRPGGIIAFGEYNITPAAMREPAGLPLSQKLFAWIEGAFRYAGAETRMGDKLFLTFRKADLPFPTLSLMSHMGRRPGLGRLCLCGRDGQEPPAAHPQGRTGERGGDRHRHAGGAAAYRAGGGQRRHPPAGAGECVGEGEVRHGAVTRLL